MGNSSSCPLPKGAEDYGDQGTSWHPMLYTAAGATVVTSVVSLALIGQHLRRYRAPKEQRQIIRIAFSVVVYSVIAFFELYKYSIAQYIDPIGDLYEAFGLCALFLLYIQYAVPSGTFDDETFQAVKAAEETETNFNWPKIAWIFVFQYPIVEAVVVAVEDVTQAAGVYCVQSLEPKYAHLWVSIFQSVSIGACVLAILRFRGRMKQLMKVRRGFAKLICFKLIVFLRFTQAWVFSLLLQHDVIKPSRQFSYNDIFYGIPSVLTCVEMVLFAFGFWYAFSASEYSSRAKPGHAPYPIGKAALHALNPTDLVLGIVRIFGLCAEVRRTGDWKAYQLASRDQGLQGAVRKGIGKYNARRRGDGRYQEMDEGMESLTRPTEMYHGRTESTGYAYQEPPQYSAGAGYGHEMYQPPAGSPPQDGEGYLTAESAPIDLQQGGRPRSPSNGYWNGRNYDRAPSPSPSANFNQEPTQGREVV